MQPVPLENGRPRMIPTRRRVILDAMLKVIDVVVGIAAIVGGVFTFVATPPTVLREVSLPVLIVLWGVLLILGGFLMTLGRLTGIWIFETTGLAGATFGAAIYLAVVSSVIDTELGVVVACSLILIAMLFMLRRYVELQIFTATPADEKGFLARLAAIWAVRTTPLDPR